MVRVHARASLPPSLPRPPPLSLSLARSLAQTAHNLPPLHLLTHTHKIHLTFPLSPSPPLLSPSFPLPPSSLSASLWQQDSRRTAKQRLQEKKKQPTIRSELILGKVSAGGATLPQRAVSGKGSPGKRASPERRGGEERGEAGKIASPERRGGGKKPSPQRRAEESRAQGRGLGAGGDEGLPPTPFNIFREHVRKLELDGAQGGKGWGGGAGGEVGGEETVLAGGGEEGAGGEGEEVEEEGGEEEEARAEVVAGKEAGGEEGEDGQDVGGDLKNDDDGIEQELKSCSPLHGVEWHRVVLDEAHRIKAWSSSTSYAANALAARFRWCLTGTPLQNRLGDLYSMLRFLRWRPWAYYFCSAGILLLILLLCPRPARSSGARRGFSKVPSLLKLSSKYTRALMFENYLQPRPRQRLPLVLV